MSPRHPESGQAPVCRLCKEKHPRGENPTPSGICHKCQLKIGVIILVIMVTMSGIVFFGLL